jgi:hypothetical protein
MKYIKQYNFGGRSVGITDEMTSVGMTYIPTFKKIGSGIQIILRVLSQQLERLSYWYC